MLILKEWGDFSNSKGKRILKGKIGLCWERSTHAHTHNIKKKKKERKERYEKKKRIEYEEEEKKHKDV